MRLNDINTLIATCHTIFPTSFGHLFSQFPHAKLIKKYHLVNIFGVRHDDIAHSKNL